MKKIIMLLVCTLLSIANNYAQNKSGLLIGGGIGFENTSLNPHSNNFIKGIKSEHYNNFNAQIGYRFRLETGNENKLFFDIDPMLKAQFLKTKDVNPNASGYSSPKSVEAHDLNLQFAISPSINYRITDRFFVGASIEPTYNIVTDGKRFDFPVLGKVGYSFNTFELAISYRQGFMNVLDKTNLKKGMTSDLSISLFIPFFSK